MTTPHTKASVRERARADRRSGPPADPAALAERAIEFLESLPGPRRVTCYASYGTEPDTGVLLRRLAEAGYVVLLPRVDGEALEWVADDAVHAVSSMGIREPTGDAVDLLPVRALLVPALAVTASGDRLGKGGGYYDRVLDSLGDAASAIDARPRIAALVRDDDIHDCLPTQPHDQRVDAIITPTRIIHCTGGHRPA